MEIHLRSSREITRHTDTSKVNIRNSLEMRLDNMQVGQESGYFGFSGVELGISPLTSHKSLEMIV